ncbi:MAG: ABA4-like family protein [Bacteriovoracia bacterium]
MLTPDFVFQIASNLALPGWLALAFWPHSRATEWLTGKALLPLALSALYFAALAVGVTAPGGAQGGFDSLANVKLLFQNDWALLAGWIHYLAFDLLIGDRIVGELERAGRNRWYWRVPLLFLTLMLGPVGFLVSRPVVRATPGPMPGPVR